MSKPSTVKTSAESKDAKPLRKGDIATGKLVLRKLVNQPQPAGVLVDQGQGTSAQ